MPNILDYLQWRADVPFSVSPFNEVDCLVFSEMVFADLNGIVPGSTTEEGVSVSEAGKAYFKRYPKDDVKLGLIVPSEIRVLLRRMAGSERYGELLLSAFVDRIDESVQKQFAAITVRLDKKHIFVAFRGTDDTLVGWKENFNMSFLEAIPAQLDAVAYLERVAKAHPRAQILVGGHSKGGNLAIYAAAHANKTVKKRIEKVYSLDGPGYRREVVQSEQYQEIQSRICNIIPQTSVIGRLLEHDDHYTVVHSSASGLWQHDGFSWQVSAKGFVPAPALSKESEMIDRSLKKWVDGMTPEQREEFVDALYNILTTTNAKTLMELTQDRNWLWKLMSASDPQDRKTVLGALTHLTGEAGRIWAERVLPALLKGKKLEELPVVSLPTKIKSRSSVKQGETKAAPTVKAKKK